MSNTTDVVSTSPPSSNGSPHNVAHVTLDFMLVAYLTLCVLCLLSIIYLRYNRAEAFKGDTTAGRKVLLPAFESLFWILGVTSGVYSLLICIALIWDLYRVEIPELDREWFYACRQFLFVLPIVFMYQKSVSLPALRRSIVISIGLSVYTVPVVWYHRTYGNPAHETAHVTVETLFRSLLILLFVYIFLWPPGRASKRTIREYCMFIFLYHIISILAQHLMLAKDPTAGIYLTHTKRLWAALSPIVIWRVLRADTEHWRGMGQRAVALQGVFQQQHHMHERISSEGLHLLIEMHRKYIIDFAHLELRQRIGVGATSTVFNGILNSRVPVAIKVYTPSVFNEDVVANFSQEAALCGALHHPNIVRFIGMCVSPPTICLVSELCQSNLEDFMRVNARRYGNQDQNGNRPQMLISLGYMLDAARAVAYLHSFAPPFLHRDIKPSNFLVDVDCNVKLTDFGESRSVVKHLSLSDDAATDFSATGTDELPTMASPKRAAHSKMTVKGTAEYMAPELINGKAGMASYGEAADVYSLAITFWDILHPNHEKFVEHPTKNHFQAFQDVMGGRRPTLNQTIHPSLREVIEAAWHQDPRQRPSAQKIVRVLESVQEDISATFVLDMLDELQPVTLGVSCSRNVVGAHVIERLKELKIVGCAAEGVRLGNAWMDAGLLHHVKHSRSFADDDSIYYFDEVHMQLCQPFAQQAMNSNHSLSDTFMKRWGSEIRTSVSMSSTDSRRITEQPVDPKQTEVVGSKCACRKFGQRLAEAKVTRRKFRRKFKAVAEENVLTTALLENSPRQQYFDSYESGSCNITIMQAPVA